MSGGDWKDMYAAAVEGDLALVRYHINAGVNPNYQHPEILCTPLVASLRETLDAKHAAVWKQDATASFLAATYQLLKQERSAAELITPLIKQLEADGPDAYDVVLCDIEMPELSGLELAASLPEPAPLLVFVTAWDQHAIRAFDLDATDVEAVVYGGTGR